MGTLLPQAHAFLYIVAMLVSFVGEKMKQNAVFVLAVILMSFFLMPLVPFIVKVAIVTLISLTAVILLIFVLWDPKDPMDELGREL